MGAAGAGGGETYVDDVFSTYLYEGTGSSLGLSTGLDMTEGGMTWLKYRDGLSNNFLVDTVRGRYKALYSNSNDSEFTMTNGVTFNNNGITVGVEGALNVNNQDYTSWNFRKAKGFFDVITYTGTGSAQTLTHGLGSVPGCIMIKRLDAATYDWAVYHSALTAGDYLKLNTNGAAASGNNRFDQGVPTSTNFAIGTSSDVNANGGSYVAYLWAGGESTAATARSVDFDGNDNLVIPATSDLSLNTNDFTYESWVYPTTYGEIVGAFNANPNYKGWLFSLDFQATGKMALFLSDGSSYVTEHSSSIVPRGQWSHLAFTKSGTNYTFYLNGVNDGSFTSSITPIDSEQDVKIAADTNPSSGRYLTGKISNLRITRQVLYTSSFKPSTEPLTTTSQGATASNVKLLCCQSSTVTTATVTPGTITTQGDPTASTDSPFDDPEGFKFGEEGDQNIIKTGRYRGNGSATGPEINLGWEPSWLLIKSATQNGENWAIFDSMRGIVSGGDDKYLYANSNGLENTYDLIELTPTGFKCVRDDGTTNRNGETFIFCAIRRPDGYVGKPAEAGTDVFAMDAGAGSSTIPNFDSGFPVDFTVNKSKTASEDWYACNRLMAKKFLQTSNNSSEGAVASFNFDSNVGWNSYSGFNSNYQSWMWKRGAGMDLVTYDGDGVVGRPIFHSLNKIPEMIWIKRRDSSGTWIVYHHGLNGGTNPWEYSCQLSETHAEADTDWSLNDTAPTSTVISLGNDNWVNGSSATYITMLFASVDGISKCGYYDGSNSAQTITVGFQPRFIIIKKTNAASEWVVLDTTRGWAAGNDNYLQLDSAAAQASSDMGAPTSTGFTVNAGVGAINDGGKKYIYYAHA